MTDPAEIIQALRDSEINGMLSWFSDGGWFVRLGDMWNGIKAESAAGSLDEAAEWLRAKAVEHYPDSEFAKRFRRGFE